MSDGTLPSDVRPHWHSWNVASETQIPILPRNMELHLVEPTLGVLELCCEEAPCSLGALHEETISIPVCIRARDSIAMIADWNVPPAIDAAMAESLSMALRSITGILDLLTGLERRLVSHPLRAGFFPSPVRRSGVGSTNPSWSTAQLASNVLESLEALVPRQTWATTTGWFPPGADPERFGQFYLTTTSDHADVVWQLHQVGVEGEALKTAAWDDEEGLTEILSHCMSNNPEILLTMQALEDADRIRSAREKHDYAVAVRAAREAFSRKRDLLRPRLSEEAVHSSAREVFGRTRDSIMPRIHVVLHLHNLTPYDVFGYKHHHAEPLAPLYAAGEIAVIPYSGPSRMPQDEWDALTRELANELAPRLRERKLGVVYEVTYDHVPHLWLAKNPELFQQHHRAFRIPEGATWRPLITPDASLVP